MMVVWAKVVIAHTWENEDGSQGPTDTVTAYSGVMGFLPLLIVQARKLDLFLT